MNSRYRTKNGRTSKRGAFLDGVWHCDCEPRMPAEKFQTKNGGKNHGRWFYTCQKAQLKRCPFFLWSDEAKIREESAVLNNSRSEPDAQEYPQPQTPRKAGISTMRQPATPESRPPKDAHLNAQRTAAHLTNETSFEWPSSGDEGLAGTADKFSDAPVPPPVFETPRKAARTGLFASPGKRSYGEVSLGTATASTVDASEDVFVTPSTSRKSHGLLSPDVTPLRNQSKARPLAHPPEPSISAVEVLKVLEHVQLPSNTEIELIELLNRHELRTQGIIKGREIARLALQTKDKKILELQARIAGLEAERETSRTVIKALKTDIAMSPSKKSGHGRAQSFGKKE